MRRISPPFFFFFKKKKKKKVAARCLAWKYSGWLHKWQVHLHLPQLLPPVRLKGMCALCKLSQFVPDMGTEGHYGIPMPGRPQLPPLTRRCILP